MKKNKLAAWLAVLLIVSSVTSSCGDTTAPTSDETTVPETEAQTEEVNTSLRGERLPSNLPDDLDLGSETVRIWYYTGYPTEPVINIAGDESGDIVDVALYERNRAIEEDLNVTLAFHQDETYSGSTGDAVRTYVMAAEDAYDYFNVCQWNAVMLAAEHMFLDLSDVPHFNFEDPWWSKQYIDACSIGTNHLYYLVGDINLDMIRCISAFYFNRQLLESLDHSADELYQLALDGKWTIDHMLTLANDAYQDINANGLSDAGDRFGAIFRIANALDSISFGLGLQLTARDENHYPYLTGDLEHNVDVFSKMQVMLNETNSVYHSTTPEDIIKFFSQGESLFMGGFLYISENLRDMADDFGILPYPKYDENQENYRSVVQDTAALACVPVTCSIFDTVTTVLEAIAYYSYYDVTPVYYESALKVKYARDEITPQVIDIIRDSAMTDTSYVYIEAFNNLGRIMREMNGYEKYTSTYARQVKATQKRMEKFIASFEEEID